MTGMHEDQKSWYAVYTKPRFEKQVHKRLQEAGIETYLPLQKTLRQWSDRKKMVEFPLFSSYVFVCISQKSYRKVLAVDGVVRFIAFEGKAASIPEHQIEDLKLLIDSNATLEISHNCYKPGQQVEVIAGALRGLRGELIKTSSKSRLLVRLNTIHQNIVVNIPENFLEIIL